MSSSCSILFSSTSCFFISKLSVFRSSCIASPVVFTSSFLPPNNFPKKLISIAFFSIHTNSQQNNECAINCGRIFYYKLTNPKTIWDTVAIWSDFVGVPFFMIQWQWLVRFFLSANWIYQRQLFDRSNVFRYIMCAIVTGTHLLSISARSPHQCGNTNNHPCFFLRKKYWTVTWNNTYVYNSWFAIYSSMAEQVDSLSIRYKKERANNMPIKVEYITILTVGITWWMNFAQKTTANISNLNEWWLSSDGMRE